MKTMTPYLLKYSITAILLTITFRYSLSYGLENKSTAIVIISAIIYGISMFASGWYFGRKDGEYLPIFDVGFRFHLVTYIIHNSISFFWIKFGFASQYENLNAVINTMIYWGIFLLIHFIFFLWARKNSINNLNKEDIFD